MDIELRHLRYFVAVAEEAGFTAAAGRVHVTQQVLSAQIRQLENAVGTALLARTSRGVTPTALWVAWRAEDLRPAVLGFVKVATGAVSDGAAGDSA